MRKLNFIIAVHPYDYASGGNNVLHNLAKIIFNKGHNVFTFGPGNFGYQYKTLNIKNYNNLSRNWDDFDDENIILNKFDKKNTFIIVPESMSDKKIELLEKYGRILVWVLTNNTLYHSYDFYNDKNKIFFYFCQGYNILNTKQDGLLRVPIIDSTYWSNSSSKINDYNSICIRKSIWYENPEDWFSLNIQKLKNMSDKNLINFDDYCPNYIFDPYSKIKRIAKDIFNKSKYFLCFDNSTFFSLSAAMSGCKTIIIPNPKENLTALEYRKKYPYASKGIAYGFDDLDHMHDTYHELLPFMKEVEQQGKNDTQNMINYCLNL